MHHLRNVKRNAKNVNQDGKYDRKVKLHPGNHINGYPYVLVQMDTNTSTGKVKSMSRKACLSDFLDDNDDPTDRGTYKNMNDKSKNQNNDSIQKNQKEFGHRKRIKP